MVGMLSVSDAILLVYLLVTTLLVALSSGPDRPVCTRMLLATIAAVVLGAFVGRVGPIASPGLRAVVYRMTVVGAVVASYLMLRPLLPLVRPDSLDEALHRADLWLFGVEPAVWLARFDVPAVVEWFSFYYFSYFPLAATYVAVVVWAARSGRATAEFAIGTALVLCVGQLGYLGVPGFGPVRHLADRFAGPLVGGFFWRCVSETVAAGGAMKDIFPSLHTALPVWFTLYASRRAGHDPRWRWPARITGWFAANIIVSTMFLRWHYGVDVLAGLGLAVVAARLSIALARREAIWRRSLGLPQAWSTASTHTRPAFVGGAEARPSLS